MDLMSFAPLAVMQPEFKSPIEKDFADVDENPVPPDLPKVPLYAPFSSSRNS